MKIDLFELLGIDPNCLVEPGDDPHSEPHGKDLAISAFIPVFKTPDGTIDCGTWIVYPLTYAFTEYNIKECLSMDSGLQAIFDSINSSSLSIDIDEHLINMQIHVSTVNQSLESDFQGGTLTIGTHEYNLYDMFNSSLIYWNINDHSGSIHTVGNQGRLYITGVDGAETNVDSGGKRSVGLTHTFITQPQNNPLYGSNFLGNYVLSWYQTPAIGGGLTCGEAVRSEDNCCPMDLNFDINAGLLNGIHIEGYKQQLVLRGNVLCITHDNYPSNSNFGCESVIDIVQQLPSNPNVGDEYLMSNTVYWYNPYHIENSGDYWSPYQDGWRYKEGFRIGSVFVESTQTRYYWDDDVQQWTTDPYETCVDLTHVNDQYLEIDYENATLAIDDIYHHGPENILDICDYLSQWTCCNICSCVLDTKLSDISGFHWPNTIPDTWTDFVNSDPTMRDLITFLSKRVAYAFNQTNSGGIQQTVTGTFFPDCGGYFPELIKNNTPCHDCDNCCEDGLKTTVTYAGYNVSSQTNIRVVIESRKQVAMRGLSADRSCQKEFNGELDATGNICSADNHNLAWFDTGNVFSHTYAYNPTALPGQQISTPYDNISGLKIPYDGIYTIFLDGPVKVNHMVHGLRISLFISRGNDNILLNEYKLDGDNAGGGAITNAYYKEEKIYYAHSSKQVPLLRGDILKLRVKLDVNCSRPWADLDPISLGRYGSQSTLWTGQAVGQAANRYIYSSTWGDIDGGGANNSFGQNVSEGVYIEYGGPSSTTHQNFEICDPSHTPTPPSEAQWVYHWLNGFFRTGTKTLTHAAHEYCPGIDFTHNHNIVARFPSIAPQAPKFIHMHAEKGNVDNTLHFNMNYRNSNSASPENNVSNRFSPAWLNPNNGNTKGYSNIGEDQYGIVTLMASGVVDESGCPQTSGYNGISKYSGFWFGWKHECSIWPNQSAL